MPDSPISLGQDKPHIPVWVTFYTEDITQTPTVFTYGRIPDSVLFGLQPRPLDGADICSFEADSTRSGYGIIITLLPNANPGDVQKITVLATITIGANTTSLNGTIAVTVADPPKFPPDPQNVVRGIVVSNDLAYA
jgi:hypothetical protein